MKIKRLLDNRDVRLLLLVAVLTLFYGIVFLPSEFLSIPGNGWRDHAMMAYFWLACETAIFGLLLLLSMIRKVFAVTFPVLNLLCTAMTYYRYVAHVELTTEDDERRFSFPLAAQWSRCTVKCD